MPGICNERDWNVCDRNERARRTSEPTQSNQIPISEYYKIGRFAIKELQMSEKTHSVQKLFTYNKIPFVFVYFTGTIVAVNTHRDKLCIEVHDGTASIKCLIEDKKLNNIEKKRAELTEAIRTLNLHNENHSEFFHQAKLIFLQITLNTVKQVPVRDEISTGITVLISGKLTEHNGTKYVFVEKINSISAEDHIKNVEDRLCQLNDETYQYCCKYMYNSNF